MKNSIKTLIYLGQRYNGHLYREIMIKDNQKALLSPTGHIFKSKFKSGHQVGAIFDTTSEDGKMWAMINMSLDRVNHLFKKRLDISEAIKKAEVDTRVFLETKKLESATSSGIDNDLRHMIKELKRQMKDKTTRERVSLINYLSKEILAA